MSLNNNTKVHALDPVNHTNEQTLLNIPYGDLLKNFTLVNVGVYDSQSTAATGLFYPAILGVMGIVKDITLKGNGVELFRYNRVGAQASMEILTNSNATNEDLSRFDLLNGCNYSIDGNLKDTYDYGDSWTQTPIAKDYHNRFDDVTSDTVNSPTFHNMIRVASSATSGPAGMIDLSKFISSLGSLVSTLPPIHNLQLIINWDASTGNFYQPPAGLPGAAPTQVASPSYTVMRPRLLVTEVLGLPRLPYYKLPLMQTIIERKVIPAVANGTIQSTNLRLNAFNGKYLQNLRFFNSTTLNSSTNAGLEQWMRASERSIAQEAEVIKINVNDRPLLPPGGINQPASKMSYWGSAFPALNLPAAAFYHSTVDMSGGPGHILTNELPRGGGGVAGEGAAVITGNYSVGAVNVGRRIERLEVEYGRTGGDIAQQQLTFPLLVIGQTAEFLEVEGENARISH